MSNVFISYSSHDRDVAERIRHDLKQHGFNVFYDKEILPGEQWAQRVGQELKRAENILVLLSPSYLNSAWATEELQAAALSESEGRARIIPVLIHDTEIPPFLRRKYFADLRENYDEGLALVEKALTITSEPFDESQAQRRRRFVDILGVLFSLLGAGLSAVAGGAVGKQFLHFDSSVVTIVIIAVVGLTALVAVISIYRPYRRTGPVEVIARTVEGAYVNALEKSNLNPVRVREISHD